MENTTNSHSSAGTLLERFDRSRLATVLIFAVVAIGFWLMNHWTPTFSDDHNYAFTFAHNTHDGFDAGRPVKSIGDLAVSYYYHALNWNGRLTNYPLSSINTGIFGKSVFDILNTIVFLGFVLIVSRLSATGNNGNGRKNSLKGNLFLIFLISGIWFLSPGFGKAFLWLCGSCNYLWATTIALCFVLAFLKVSEKSVSAKCWPFLAVFAFVAGAMHEGVSLGISAGLFFHCVFRFKEKKLSWSEVLIAAFFWIGTIAVVFNIGIITRGLGALSSNKSNPFSPAGLGLNIIRILWFSKIGVLTVLALLVALWKKPRKTQEFLKDNIIFVAAICALYPFFFLFGGGVAENAVFGLVTFSAILLFRFIGFVDKTRWIKILAIPFTCLAVVHISFFVLPEMKENKAEHDALFQEIVKSDADVVCFNNLKGRVDVDGRYVVRNMYDTIAVPSSFQSKWLCNYYGAKIRPIVPKSVYDFIFEGVVAEPHQKLNDGWIDFPGSWFFVKKLDHKPEELSDLRIKFEIDFEQATFEQKFLLIPLLQKAGRLPVSGIYIQPKRISCVVKNTQGQYFLLALHERTLEGSLRTPIKTIAIEET